MEEKNQNEAVAENAITDDTEIDVGMIEKSILFDKEQHKEQYVWLLKGSIWKTYSFSKILDLIHRLQSENEKLKRKCDVRDKDNDEWYDTCSEMEKTIAEQKAEIERMTEERNEYKGLYETMYRKWSDLSTKDLNCEKSREIAREYLNKNAELQKQVNELTKKGKWVECEKAYTSFVCSECGGEPMYSPDKKGKAFITITQYCPTCGAKMNFDEEVE